MKKWIILSIVAACVCSSFLTVGLAAKKKKPKLEITGAVKHRFLGSSYRGKLYIADKEGKIEWEFAARNVQDIFMLAGGRVLFNTGRGAKIVRIKDKKVLWEYKFTGKGEIHSCQPLKNGNVLITISGQSKIVEVDKDGKVAKEIEFAKVSKYTGDWHMELRDSLKTDKGTYLVAFCHEGVIREFDTDAKMIRTIKTDYLKPKCVSSLQVLKNGNVLVGGAYGKNVLEIDKNDKVVWSLTQNDIKGINLGYVATAKRLKTGNTLVSLYHGSYAFFEVDKDKKIVWSIKGGPFHATTAIEYLD
ncbi:MAG: PQQ-binding-like beta-propeller repeat protein [bacterium]|nr:PQQ-binding-like beta-propeller repeat protein [bacterium]